MTVQPADSPELAPSAETDRPEPSPEGRKPLRLPPRRLLVMAALGVLLAVLLYYPVGAWRAHVIDDDLTFTAPVEAGGSKAAAIAAALLRREIDVHGWTPNKPFFMPAAVLTDMPNFQMGITAMIGRFALEMDEQIGRPAKSEGTTSDPDLDRAAGLMQYPPTVWMIDPAAPWARTISTEKQYRNAARALEAYNQRLAAGTASFAREPEVLQAVLERFGKELEATAATLEPSVTESPGWFGRSAGRAYFGAKGRAYTALLLLRALGEDYQGLLAERNLTDQWSAMLASLQAAASPRPWIVLAGDPDSVWVPNHPAVQGFHLLRARSRLAELAEALH